MNLARTSNLLTCLVVGLLASACVSVWLAAELNRTYRAELKQLHQASDAISHLQLRAHERSAAVRSFVTTREEAFFDDYQDLLRSAEVFDLVVQDFLSHRMSGDYVLQLIRARDKAEMMAAYEREAFELGRSGSWHDAIERVFGQNYQRAAREALEPLLTVEQALHLHGDTQTEKHETRARLAMFAAIILTLGGLLLVALALRRFYHRRVLGPMIEMTEKTNRLLQGEYNVSYQHAQEHSEIGDLSRALTRYRDSMRTLDKQSRAFAEAETWYRQIIEFAPDGMLVVDESGQILIANPKAHEQFGYQAGAMLGLCVDDLVPEDIRPGHARMRARFMEDTRTRGMGSDGIIGDFRAVDRHGREFPVELGLTRLPLIEGRSPCACVSIRDISERKRLDQQISDQLAFQRVLLDTLPYPVFVKDAQARYLDFNQAFLNSFDVKREELLGQTVTQLLSLPAEDLPAYQAANRKIVREGGRYVAEMQIPLADGEVHPTIYSLSSFNDSEGRVAGLVGTLIDISAQKQAELDQARARQLAEEATRLKSDFLANMSHEIRTPMNVISGMAHLALGSGLQGRQRHYVEKIQTAAQGLLRIINDILDFSKIEAGRMHFEKANFILEDVLNTLADQATVAAQEKGLELLFDIDTEVPTALVGDSLRLGQILNNLMSNALKFTARGEVTLSIRQERQVDNQVWLYFEVRDTGIGMSAEQLSRLFRAFTQADSSTSRKYGGTGLGLTICQRLVQLMGGEIGVDSEPDIGSTFYFRAPFGLQPEQRKLDSVATDLLGMSILVVDDNATAREIFTGMLTSLKFQVDSACSADEAIGKLEQAAQSGSPFRLVLMDWMMPDVDGIEALRRIRQDRNIAQTPLFIMATAYSRDELLQRLDDLQVEDVLVKPVTPSTLLDSILNAFGREALARPRRQVISHEVEKARRSLYGARVLLAEDNVVNQEMTVEILSGAGIHVDIANNGAEALALLAQNTYDGVLMDCQMPVMDGFEATRRIRQMPGMQQLPILAMTANALAEDKEQCLAAGMNEHIPKPLDVDKLFITIAQWFQGTGEQASPVAATEHMALPDIASLNLDSALQRLGGNSALLHKLLKRFCETEQDCPLRVRQALAAEQTADAVRALHSLRGLAGNIGAREIALRAGDLEAMLRHSETEHFDTALDELEATLGNLISQIRSAINLRSLVPSSDAPPAQDIDIDLLLSELNRLETLLQNDEGESLLVLEPWLPALNALGHNKEADTLADLIGRYAYDEALQVLTVLHQSLRA